MNHWSRSFRAAFARLAALAGLTAILVLSGCALGTTAFPDTPGTGPESQSTLGTIQGSNYGGHAPIVGAHVFVLEGYTSSSGYYQPAKSLLSASYTGNYPTALEPAGTAVSGDYYVTTDSRGAFGVSGDYTCDPGYPVYLYAEGGNPQTISSVTITGATGTVDANNQTLVTFTTSGTQLLYQGERITFATFSNGGVYNSFSGTTQTVSPLNLTTSTFAVELSSNIGSIAQASFTTTASQATVSNNPAVVNLAVLGICPSSGTANFSYLNFVYMNEVSTVAAAYALGGFFPSPGTSGLSVAGAVAANLSIPANDAQALLGLQNAAITADQLYDIQGSNSGTGADGETHISRTTTPGVAVSATTTNGSATVSVGTTVGLQVGVTISGPGIPANTTITAINTGVTPNTLTLSANATASGTNVLLRAGAGNGTVPQTLLSTIGNILANCVDSANTSVVTANESSQCSTLFADTLSAGTSGTRPIDTATAAIDIAHNPWANVSALVNLPSGNAPFQPSLSSANDFAVGIKYTPANVSNPEGIAVDASGNIWYPNANNINAGGYVTTLTPFGGVLYNSAYVSTQIPHYITIDGTGTAWYGDSNNGTLNKVSKTGVFQGAYKYSGTAVNFPYSIASDGKYGTGYIYLEDLNNASVDYFDGNGNTMGVVPDEATCLNGQHADHAAFDQATYGNNLWTSSENGGFICKPIRTSSTTYSATSYAKYTLSPSASPNAIAIDYFGIAYVAANSTDEVVKVAAGASSGTTPTVLTGATLSSPFGVAIDGQGHIFVSNRTGNNISQFTSSGAVSAVNYTGSGTQAGTYFSDPLNIAIDPSGAIWVTNYTGNRIVELLGVGVPTYTPLSLAAYTNNLGARP